MAKKLSIKDIAADLNISKTTVSFILNGKAKEMRISDHLVDRVLKYVEEKNYRPNQLAKSLSTGKTMIIGLMVENISDYFFAQVAYHIEELANQSGYKIIYCSTDNRIQKTRELISLFRDRQVDGYIITPPLGTEKEIQALVDDGFPVVLFDRYFPDIATNYVVIDNYEASLDAVSHLTSRYKNIAMVILDSEQSQMRDRERGYTDALAARQLPALVHRVPIGNDAAVTVKGLVKFIKKNPQVDAIFFSTNYLTFSGIKALNQLNLKTPQDIAVVAFDDHDAFDTYLPTITAVAQPINALAKETIGILLNELNAVPAEKVLQQKIVPAKLIKRDSTR